MKDKATQVKKEATTVVQNFTQLIEAVSLIVVSSFAIYNANQSKEYWAYPVLIAGAVIAIRGGLEFIKYLKRG